MQILQHVICTTFSMNRYSVGLFESIPCRPFALPTTLDAILAVNEPETSRHCSGSCPCESLQGYMLAVGVIYIEATPTVDGVHAMRVIMVGNGVREEP